MTDDVSFRVSGVGVSVDTDLPQGVIDVWQGKTRLGRVWVEQDTLYSLDSMFGFIELHNRWEPCPCGQAFCGRNMNWSVRVDRNGNRTKESEWPGIRSWSGDCCGNQFVSSYGERYGKTAGELRGIAEDDGWLCGVPVPHGPYWDVCKKCKHKAYE